MGWTRKPRSPRIIPQAASLDDVREPGDHSAQYSSQATRAKGYPWDNVAGIATNVPWWGPNLIQYFATWNGGVAKRTYYNGAWQSWRDLTGKEIV